MNTKKIKLFIYYFILIHLPYSHFPGGKIYRKLRYKVCRDLFLSCGKNVLIEPKAYIPFWKVKIGNNSGIGFNARLGAVEIGNDVMMGHDVIMISRNHSFSVTDKPMNFKVKRVKR